jgi:hypothetical protein
MNDEDQSDIPTWFPSASPAPKPLPPDAPAAPASNWEEILQNAAPKYSGQSGGSATVFATPKDLKNYAVTGSLETGDNGVGSPALGSVNTAASYGVAVPEDVMTKLYGGRASDPSTTANWRTARAQVTVNGKTYVVPISDLGPGGKPDDPKTPRGQGRVTDLTSDLAKGIPGWMSDDADGPVQIKLLPPGSGPDYLTDRKGWHAEQENIGKQLTPTPLGSSDIVRPPSSENPPVPPLGFAPRALPVNQPGGAPQSFQNPASGNTEPVQTFAKGGVVLPITDDEEPDEGSYTPLGKHLGGHWSAVNA